MDLDDKVVVITGGAQGLGLATAIRLAGKKPRIVLIDTNPHQLAEARQVVEAAGATVSTWECNVSDEDAVDKIFDQINMHNGRLDAVINNAGVTRDALLLKIKEGVVEKRMSLKEWNQVIDVNLTGTFLCGRAAATEMVKAANGGCIINISSISRHGNMGQTNYTATKAGVAAMAVTWAKELAEQGIRCVAIAPGYIGTEMVLNMKTKALEKIAAGIPVRRLGQPDEIARTVEFILENEYVNGRVIEVDGGLRV
ncbi:MAG: 3-oxoacyl-ACP reductase [Gammaproteobacteria bacterium]|nr:3-oxoacyl-ACP reductase [Gammaproteobacteria bacterium]